MIDLKKLFFEICVETVFPQAFAKTASPCHLSSFSSSIETINIFRLIRSLKN
ncbi:unnamed protein product [Meloidogyne enterolobii]|uniref:Uncharacterized protein n=1 Tax=Meloidogyne enterolobii TaxID=390850 RepID=A0ACB1AI08_MELEN